MDQSTEPVATLTPPARRRNAGFTLVELLIVIAILGILSAVVVFAVGGITDRGATTACKADRQTVEVAVEAYRAQNGAYPATQAALVPGFLRSPSSLYDVGAGGAITPKTQVPASATCAA